MDGMYCKKCKAALIKCGVCGGSGKEHGHRCTRCAGGKYLCPAHGPNWK